MNSRPVLLVLAFGFGILVVLIAILGFGAIRRADAIYKDMKAAQDSYSETESFRRGIATDIYLAALPSDGSSVGQQPLTPVARIVSPLRGYVEQ